MKHLVLAAMPRSGSTVIAEMLALHPAIMGFTEIFNDDSYIRSGCHNRGVNDNGMYVYRSGPYGRPDLYLNFLEAAARLRGKSVLSYKLMESQCPSMYAELPHRRASIVHLRRENLIALAASWKIAVASKRWHCVYASQREEVKNFTCRVETSDIEEWERREEAQADIINSTRMPVLKLTYREIAEGPRRVVRRLFDLIEVASVAVEPTQIKVNDRPLSQMVENLADLQSKLAGSAYEWMASDDKGDW